MPTLGQSYSRDDIAHDLGGGTVEFLPNVGGRIVCACLRLDYNPDAPDVILPGKGPLIQQTAEWLCEQRGPIPVFIKRGAHAWEYVGNYKVRDFSTDAQVIAEQEARSGRTGREGITRVIYMEPSRDA